MLGVDQDEADGKHHSHSPLLTLKRKVGSVFSRNHKDKKDRNRDSAGSTSSEGSDLGPVTSVTAESAAMTTMSCHKTEEASLPSSCVQMQCENLTFASKCVQDSDKVPADKTIVHVMSPISSQGDGLLQCTDKCIGKDAEGNPVYSVNCKGTMGNTNTNLVWYLIDSPQCSDCKRIFLHLLQPGVSGTDEPEIPLEMYSYRLCRFKVNDHYVLAAHKAAQATPLFDDDDDAVIDVCYHPTKGGMVTLQENSSSRKAMDGMFCGTRRDGEVILFSKSAHPGYCTNPFTLFYIYDEEGSTTAMKRMYGEW